MGDVNALEVVAYPWEVAKTFVGEAPVGEHTGDGGEDVERAGGAAAAVCGEECGYHDVAAVAVDGGVVLGRCGCAT